MRKEERAGRQTNQVQPLFTRIPWMRLAELLLRFLMLLAAAACVLRCMIALYDLTLPTDALWRLLILMGAVIFFASILPRRGLWISLLAVLFGVFVWRHAEMLVQGWLLLIEQALLPMELVLPDVMQNLLQSVDTVMQQERLLLAVGSLLAVLLPLLAACTVAGTHALGLILTAMPILLPGIVAGRMPPLVPLAVLVTICLMLAAYRGAVRAAFESLSDDIVSDEAAAIAAIGVDGRLGAWLSAMLIMMPAAALTLLLSMQLLPEAGYERPSYASKLRESFLEMDFASLFDMANDGLSHGDLTALSDIRFTGEAALAVRVSEPRQLYLAGYTAASFTGTNWENPEQSVYRQAAQGFASPLPQNLYAAISDAAPYTISVKHIDAETGTLYLPNGLQTAADMIECASIRQDGALGGSAQTAEMGYTAAVLPYVTVPHAFPAAESLRASYLAAAANAAANVDTSVQQSAQAYAAYVTDTYTQLPDDVRFAAQQLCAQYGLSLETTDGSYDVAALCRNLREVLRTQCRYVYEPQPMPPGADFATWFLRESREGYCVHFATTAAILLRSLGIPTRYAEGYIVIRSDYEKPMDSEGYVLIEDTHAHAWAEVFDPVQLVWVPVEMTPSASDAAAPTATPEPTMEAQPQAEETPIPSEPPTEEPSPEPSTPTETDMDVAEQTPPPEETGEPSEDHTAAPTEDPMDTALSPGQTEPPTAASETPRTRAWLYILLSILLLLGGAAAYFFRKRRFEARLSQPDANAAVLTACMAAQTLLYRLGCSARAVGQSAEDYAAALAHDRPWLHAAQFARLLQMGERAVFSAERCSARDREEAIRLYTEIRNGAEASLPPMKRILLQLRRP